jgi:hypothetical protein
MLAGEFDGSNRNHFFQGVIVLSSLPNHPDARGRAAVRAQHRARAGHLERSALEINRGEHDEQGTGGT